MAARRTAKRTLSVRRLLKPQSLLILHLDAEKLRSDGLHLGDAAKFSATLAALAFGSGVEVRDTTTLVSLLQTLAEFASGGRTFDVVVIIAHSNAEVIRIASDERVDWPAFARYLKPLQPKRLLLVACRAGRWNAGEALFKVNSQLRRIYACPVNASKDFGALMLVAVPYVVAKRRPHHKHVFWSHVSSIGLTGRQLREWKRTTDKGNPDSLVFDLIADVADPYARRVPQVVDAMLRSFLGGE
jgi:hypothetical protein